MQTILEAEVVGDENVPPRAIAADEKAGQLTVEAMRSHHAKEKASWDAVERHLQEQLAMSEANAGQAVEGAQMALESAEAASRSAVGAETSRKNAEAKLEAAKAQIAQLVSEKEQWCHEAEAAKARAEKAEAAKLAEVDANKATREASLLKEGQVAELQERLREKEEKRKAAVAEKEQLQKETKSCREQQKHFQKRFEDDEAEKRRLQQQATNAKAEVERLKKEAREAGAGAASAAAIKTDDLFGPPQRFKPKLAGRAGRGRAASKERAQPDERGRDTSKERGCRDSSKERAPAYERAASMEPVSTYCPENQAAPLSARGSGSWYSLFGRGR